MADSKNIDGRGPYEAIGKVIRKLPVKTKVEGATHIEVGFPVCEVTEYLDEDGAKAVAQLMNRGDVFEHLLKALSKLTAECVKQDIKFGPLIADAQDAIARAEGRS